MSLLLNIDTSLETGSVCLSDADNIVEILLNHNQQDHAAWLHPAIQSLLKQNNITASQLDAIAVTIGPGSYTGLRIGLAAAKGICYALNKPLITINTLEVLASAVVDQATDLICPVIDARRMEIFTAVYDKNLQVIEKPTAMVVDKESFTNILADRKLLFCGNAVNKIQPLITSSGASFTKMLFTAKQLVPLAIQRYNNSIFADIAYTEPLYLKEFHFVKPKGTLK